VLQVPISFLRVETAGCMGSIFLFRIDRRRLTYTVSQKTSRVLSVITLSNLTDFQKKFFRRGKAYKFCYTKRLKSPTTP